MTQDVAEEKQEGTQDVSSEKASVEEKQSSEEPPKFSEEQELEVQKRVSDRLAKRGDKAKTLEDTVKEQGATIKQLTDEKLASTATKYGFTLQQVIDAGMTTPEEVEAKAKLFGKTEGQAGETKAGETTAKKEVVDSGRSAGGGAASPESASGKMKAGFDALHK